MVWALMYVPSLHVLAEKGLRSLGICSDSSESSSLLYVLFVCLI